MDGYIVIALLLLFFLSLLVLSHALRLQLDFAATVSALLGLPIPFGRCSVRDLSRHLLITSTLAALLG